MVINIKSNIFSNSYCISINILYDGIVIFSQHFCKVEIKKNVESICPAKYWILDTDESHHLFINATDIY